VYRTLIEPALPPGTAVTHVVCCGFDGWRSVVSIDDVLADAVLIAEHLDGRPLDSDHGAPARLVSPQADTASSAPSTFAASRSTHPSREVAFAVGQLPMRLLSPHPRARVWKEERHRHLPPWSVRRVYRANNAPFAYLCARGGRDVA
jgi:DMSO/TMAO reductase YedYZ molybdopterin-dependent catalytic subunit